jgi:Putative Ig domain
MRKDSSSQFGIVRQSLVVAGFIVAFLVSGCSNGKAALSVALTPSTTQTLDQGQSVQITAAVAKDSKNQGVAWTLSPASGEGTLSNTTSGSATYTAPATVASATTATITATSVTDTTKSASLTIDLVAPPSVTTSSMPAGNVGASYDNTVSATGGVAPFSWSLASGSLPAGLALAASTTNSVHITGTPTTQGTSTFTVKVTDAGGLSSTSQSLSITIGAAATLQITSSSPLPDGNVGAAYSQTLQATGGLKPYSWAVTVGSLPAGLTMDASGAISGTPTTTGTSTFTVQVTDSQTPPAQSAPVQFSITIDAAIVNACGAPQGSESALNGEYAFLVQGFQGTSGTPVTVVASFAADGTGKVTAGEEDMNSSAGPQHVTVNPTGSFYSVGSDKRGCVTLLNSGGNTTTFHFALGGINGGVASKGRIIEFDDSSNNGAGTRGSGILRQQDTTAFSPTKLKSNYAFGLDGVDFTSGHVAVGGSFGLSGGTITNSVTDVDDAGTNLSDLTGGVGGLGTISATTGRATGTYAASTLYSFNFVAYIVNANELFVATTDTLGASTPMVSGKAIVTGASGSFSQSSISGNYIIHVSGSDSGVADVTLGLLSLSGGAGSGTLNQYDGTTLQSNPVSGGTYSVDSTSGRVALTNFGNHSPVLYLTSGSAATTDGISAFIVGTDSSAIFGAAELQPSATYSTSSVAGTYFFGTEDPSDNTVADEAGAVMVASNGTVTGTEDKSDQSGLSTNKAVSGTVTINANGTGDIGPSSVAITNGTKLFFVDGSGGSAVIHVVEK